MQWKYIIFYGVRTLRKTSKTNYVLFFVIRLRTLNRHEFLHAFLSSKFEFENIYSGVNFYEDIIIILLLLLFYFLFFFSFAGTYPLRIAGKNAKLRTVKILCHRALAQ